MGRTVTIVQTLTRHDQSISSHTMTTTFNCHHRTCGSGPISSTFLRSALSLFYTRQRTDRGAHCAMSIMSLRLRGVDTLQLLIFRSLRNEWRWFLSYSTQRHRPTVSSTECTFSPFPLRDLENSLKNSALDCLGI